MHVVSTYFREVFVTASFSDSVLLSVLQDVMNKRIDARMREASISPCCRNAFANLKPAIKNEKGAVEANVLVKKVTWEQDSDWRAMNEPAFIVSNPHEGSYKLGSDVIVQQSHNSRQDGPPCQLQETTVDTEVEKIDNKEEIFGTLAEEIDSENCTNRQRKVQRWAALSLHPQVASHDASLGLFRETVQVVVLQYSGVLL